MADIDQLLLELRALQKKFELAIPISDFDRSFLVFDQLRKDGNVCLWRVLTCGYLRSIPGSRRAFDLFDDLIGFSPSEHLDQDIFGSFWCVKAGLIDQPEVWTDIQSKQAPDEMAVWNECGFHLLTGCANGLGRLIEIIEREVATTLATQRADNQADEDGLAYQLPGTLTENDRSILIAMLDLKADKIHPRAGKEILGAVIFENEVGDSKRAFDNLKSLKLIKSKTGPSGGRYLTEQGMEIAKEVKTRSGRIVPTN
jgi:hypothetical protein